MSGGVFTDDACTTAATLYDATDLKAKQDAETDKTKWDSAEKF
mgnify:CR=1 FL=1